MKTLKLTKYINKNVTSPVSINKKPKTRLSANIFIVSKSTLMNYYLNFLKEFIFCCFGKTFLDDFPEKILQKESE